MIQKKKQNKIQSIHFKYHWGKKRITKNLTPEINLLCDKTRFPVFFQSVEIISIENGIETPDVEFRAELYNHSAWDFWVQSFD